MFTGRVIGDPFGGHTDFVLSVAFSPDGMRIVSGSVDNTVRVWDADRSRSVKGQFQEHIDDVSVVAFSPDGSWIVSGSHDCTLRIWDAQTDRAVTKPLYAIVNLSSRSSSHQMESASSLDHMTIR